MKKPFFLIIFICLLLFGCATVRPINLPGNTVTSPQLRTDIIHMIDIIEKAQNPGCSYKIIDTKVVAKEENTIWEDWIIQSCSKNIVYSIRLTPSPRGGTDFSIKAPGKR